MGCTCSSNTGECAALAGYTAWIVWPLVIEHHGSQYSSLVLQLYIHKILVDRILTNWAGRFHREANPSPNFFPSALTSYETKKLINLEKRKQMPFCEYYSALSRVEI